MRYKWKTVLFTAGCDAPPDGTQTVDPDAATKYLVNADFAYQCESGYVYDGDSADLTVTCEAGTPAAWSAGAPTCVGKFNWCQQLLSVFFFKIGTS